MGCSQITRSDLSVFAMRQQLSLAAHAKQRFELDEVAAAAAAAGCIAVVHGLAAIHQRPLTTHHTVLSAWLASSVDHIHTSTPSIQPRTLRRKGGLVFSG